MLRATPSSHAILRALAVMMETQYCRDCRMVSIAPCGHAVLLADRSRRKSCLVADPHVGGFTSVWWAASKHYGGRHSVGTITTRVGKERQDQRKIGMDRSGDPRHEFDTRTSRRRASRGSAFRSTGERVLPAVALGKDGSPGGSWVVHACIAIEKHQSAAVHDVIPNRRSRALVIRCAA